MYFVIEFQLKWTDSQSARHCVEFTNLQSAQQYHLHANKILLLCWFSISVGEKGIRLCNKSGSRFEIWIFVGT